MKRYFIFLLLASLLSAKEIYATFDVVAKKSASLAFEASGLVNKVNVDIGDQVSKGDILAALNNSDLKAKKELDLVNFKYAKSNYELQLKAKNTIDKLTFNRFKFNYLSAKRKLEYTQALLDKTFLKAPFDGVITDKKVEVGDVVSAMAPRELFKLESKRKKLILKIDQKYASYIKVGDEFKYKIDGSKQYYKGKISKIYPSVDSSLRVIKAEVEVGEKFKSGLFGSGVIEVSDF